MGVIIYEEKGNKVESKPASRTFFFSFFFWEDENRESKNLWMILVNVAHCSKFVTHFFNKRKLVYIFFNKRKLKIKEKKISKNQFQTSSLLNQNITTWKKNHNFNNIAKSYNSSELKGI